VSRPYSVFFFIIFFFLEGLSFSFPLRDLSLCHPLSLLRFFYFLFFFIVYIYIAILLGLIVIYSLFLILVD
jgi:hypothetical protein